MSSPRNIAFGAITALWLTAGCANSGGADDTRVDPLHAEPDTTEMVFIPSIDQLEAQGQECDDGLVETLINRDVYERLAQADNFNEMADELPEGASLSDRINAYKDERREKISTFFDCRDENGELHDLASSIIAIPGNPTNPDKFRELFVDIASERMDDVRDLYPAEMMTDAAKQFKDIIVEMNSARIDEVGPLFNDDKLDARIDEMIHENHDQMALAMARMEMADYLGMEGAVEGSSPQGFMNQFQSMVAFEVANYLREVILTREASGPTYEI